MVTKVRSRGRSVSDFLFPAQLGLVNMMGEISLMIHTALIKVSQDIAKLAYRETRSRFKCGQPGLWYSNLKNIVEIEFREVGQGMKGDGGASWGDAAALCDGEPR